VTVLHQAERDVYYGSHHASRDGKHFMLTAACLINRMPLQAHPRIYTVNTESIIFLRTV
jgi:hypothetical protein